VSSSESLLPTTATPAPFSNWVHAITDEVSGRRLVAIAHPNLGGLSTINDNSYGPNLLDFVLSSTSSLLIRWTVYQAGTGDPVIGLRNNDTATSWWFDAYNPGSGLDAFPGSWAMKGRGSSSSYHTMAGPTAYLVNVPAGSYTVRSYKTGTGIVQLAENAGMVEVWAA
jgi:hypothetical protein